MTVAILSYLWVSLLPALLPADNNETLIYLASLHCILHLLEATPQEHLTHNIHGDPAHSEQGFSLVEPQGQSIWRIDAKFAV